MIKLLDILLELKAVHNLDMIDTSRRYTIFWNNGDLTAMPPEYSSPLTLTKLIQLSVDPNKQLVRIADYDDWSSFKGILSNQQAVKDLIRAKLITADWNIEISMTDLKKTIGSFKVKDFLKYDASFTKTIPVAFHGTTTRELKSIQRLGVVPPSATDREMLKWDSYYQDDSADKTYWSIDFSRAEYYAGHAAQLYQNNGISAKPIVVEIRDWPISNITADDDFKSNMGMIQMLASMQKGKPIDLNSPIQSIRSTSQFAIKGRVPANKIVKIHKI